jgi:ABC-type Fe3+-hydroxamate transport system substrate-binding protein
LNKKDYQAIMNAYMYLFKEISMGNFIKLFSIFILSLFLVSCIESSMSQTGLVSFNTENDTLEITFSESLLETYERLLLQLEGIDSNSKVAVLTSSTANLFFDIGIPMVAVPTSRAPFVSGLQALVDSREVLTIGNYNTGFSLEVLANIKPDVLFAADSITVPESLNNYLVITLPQSTYYDIFITLALMEEVFGLSSTVQPVLKELASDHSEAFSYFEDQKEEHTVAIVQSIYGQQLFNSKDTLVGSIVSMMPVVNVFANNIIGSGALNLELLLEQNPDYIIVHGFGDDPDAALAFFLGVIRDENGLWQTLDAVKNNRIIVLGNTLIGPSADVRVTKAFLEISKALFLNETSS